MLNKKIYIFCTISAFLFFCTDRVFAQEPKDLVYLSDNFKNPEIPAVCIKWYSPTIITFEGFNVYRAEAGSTSWTKLNAAPVKLKQPMPEALKKDPKAESLWKSVLKIEKKDAGNLRFFGIMIGMKAIENNDFADAIGIYYEDKSVAFGQSVHYQIREITESGGENLIGTSDVIVVKKWKQPELPQEIKFYRKKKQVDFGWKVEPKRIFSVDIYKWTKKHPEKVKLNSGPIVMNKNQEGKYDTVFYNDMGIHKDTTYFYQIVGNDFFGNASEFSEVLKSPAKNFDLPQPPFNLKYSADYLTVKITWSSPMEKDLSGYYIYRSQNIDSNYVRLNRNLIPKNDSVFKDKVPRPGDYFYIVSTVNEAQLENESTPLIADVRDVKPPAVPKYLKAKIDSGNIVLSWDVNTEKDLKGYLIYRAIDGSDEFVILSKDAIAETTYKEKISKKTRNKFIYKIAAQDSSLNKSELSEPVSAQLPDIVPPEEPVILLAEQKGKGIQVNWIPNVDTDFMNYVLCRKTESQKDTAIKIISEKLYLSDTSFVDTAVTNNTSYFYFLIAKDSSGLTSLSKSYKIKYFDGTCKIVVKTFNGSFDQKKKSVNLDWRALKGNDFYGYLIFRKEGSKKYTQLTGRITAEVYTDKEISAGKKYSYQLKAFDTLGNIQISNEIIIETN